MAWIEANRSVNGTPFGAIALSSLVEFIHNSTLLGLGRLLPLDRPFRSTMATRLQCYTGTRGAHFAWEYSFISAFAMSIAVSPIQPGRHRIRVTAPRNRAWLDGAALHVELGSFAWRRRLGVGSAIDRRFNICFKTAVVTLACWGVFGCVLLLRFAWDAWRASRSRMLRSKQIATAVQESLCWRARCCRCRIHRICHRSGWA